MQVVDEAHWKLIVSCEVVERGHIGRSPAFTVVQVCLLRAAKSLPFVSCFIALYLAR